jgi:glycosyltransferase involved in cell wall biosynthesis
MTALRLAAFADASPRPRALATEFAVEHRALSALRLPENLHCSPYRKAAISNPLVSIVVPVHNRQHTLQRALNSALALQDCAPIEVIVVDDRSDDGTTALLMELDDPRISALSLLRRHGANTARNVGIAIARAPVIAFLDSDDNYSEGRLSDPLYLLAHNPDVGVVISSFVACKGKVERSLRLREQVYDSEAFSRLIAGYILPPCTSGLTVRRELLLTCGGFDPQVRRMQDRDLLLRLAPSTKAASSAVVCWQKHWSNDGISSPRTSYYEGLRAFLARHPVYADEELSTRNYLIARHLVALLKCGFMARALEVYRHARTTLTPPVRPLPLLLTAYLATKRRRRKAQAAFHISTNARPSRAVEAAYPATDSPQAAAQAAAPPTSSALADESLSATK